MKPWLAIPLVSTALTGCGGLYSSADGGTGGGNAGTGLGPPACMRTFADAITVKSPAGANAFTDIVSLAFDKDRHLHVLNRKTPGGSFVAVLGAPPNTGFLRSYGQGKLDDVQDFTIDAAGTVYVLDDPSPGDPVVSRFDAMGTFLSSFPADANGGEDTGLSIAIDGSGKLNVGGSQRLYRYETNGTYVGRYGYAGKGVGNLMWPTDLVWDPTSNTMWVADLFQNFVEQYTPGVDTQVNQYGGRGVGNGKFDANEPSGNTFYGPNRLAVDAKGNVYASDPYSSRLQKLGPTGAYLGQFDFGTSRLFDAVVIDPATGILYAARGTTIDVICPF